MVDAYCEAETEKLFSVEYAISFFFKVFDRVIKRSSPKKYTHKQIQTLQKLWTFSLRKQNKFWMEMFDWKFAV